MPLPIWNTTSGNIGTVQELDIFSFSLSYSNPDPSPLTVSIISGNLPDGLTMDSSGNITGTVSAVPAPYTSNFTVRLENSTGIVDRGFNIEVTNISATWPDPSNLGSFVYYSYYEYQLQLIDTGGLTQKFLKISGELPKGIELNESGLLQGFVDPVDADTVYTFTIRATLNDVVFQDKTFSITILVNGNRAPVWNTPAGYLGEINTVMPFNFQFSAGDPDGDSLTYSGVGLPPGLSISSSGLLSGLLSDGSQTIYTFNITVTDGVANSSRLFSLNANEQDESNIVWLTPSGSLGDINEGVRSLFKVEAQTSSNWLRYEVVSGSLPDGMTLDVNTGAIWGMANEQGATTTYTFEIRAYNSIVSEVREFSITVNDFYSPSATKVQVYLWAENKEDFYDLYTSNLIPINTWFRQGDDQYGLVEKPRILLTESLDAPTKDEVFNVLDGVRRTNFVLGKVQTAKAVKDGEIVYEVLYRTVYDDAEGALLQFNDPQTSQLIKTGALHNCRERLLTLGLSGQEENLPLWMTSEQIIGNPDTVIGWIPALVFAHVKAGTGEQIAQNLNNIDIQKKKLYSRYVRVDRVVIEPAADSTFEPDVILYDNLY